MDLTVLPLLLPFHFIPSNLLRLELTIWPAPSQMVLVVTQCSLRAHTPRFDSSSLLLATLRLHGLALYSRHSAFSLNKSVQVRGYGGQEYWSATPIYPTRKCKVEGIEKEKRSRLERKEGEKRYTTREG
jgi:hypothetical protein